MQSPSATLLPTGPIYTIRDRKPRVYLRNAQWRRSEVSNHKLNAEQQVNATKREEVRRVHSPLQDYYGNRTTFSSTEGIIKVESAADPSQ
jgi:hypothetical protein